MENHMESSKRRWNDEGTNIRIQERWKVTSSKIRAKAFRFSKKTL